MAETHLLYGKGFVTATKGKSDQIDVIDTVEQPGIGNLVQEAIDAFSYRCIGTPGLHQMVHPEDRFTIVVRGSAHQWMGQYALIPSIVYYLNQMGVPTKQIALVVGSATEGRVDPKELDAVVHPEIRREMEAVSCHNPESRDVVETTTVHGTRVRLNGLLTKRKVIVLDGVRPHPLLTFCGGGLPVLQASAWETAQNFMRLAVHKERLGFADGVINSQLSENPLCQFLKEVGDSIAPFFGVYVLSNHKNEPCKIFCGHWWESWLEACRQFYPLLGTKVHKQYKVVLASAGGAPFDDTFYSAMGGMLHAGQMVTPGHKVFYVAQCQGGGPDRFFSSLMGSNVEQLYEQLRTAPQSMDDLLLFLVALLMPSYNVGFQTKLGMREMPFQGLNLYRTMETMETQIPFDEGSICVMPRAVRTYPYF